MADVIVNRDVSVNMRDGVTLKANVYRPDNGEQPALLVRTPYDKTDITLHSGMLPPLEAAEQGFAVVFQDCRGRFASDGNWEPFVCEGTDGYDTVEWIADQPWCNGRVGVTGASYCGVTAWQAVISDPPHLEAALPMITAGNLHNGWTYSGGAFELGFNYRWTTSSLVGRAFQFEDIPEEERETLYEEFVGKFDNASTELEKLPLNRRSRLFDVLGPFYREWLAHPSYDSYWEQVDVTEQVESISVPVLEIGGWYDKFVRGHFDVADAIAEKADDSIANNHHLVVGPWDHHSQFSPAPTIAGERDFGIESAMPSIVEDFLLPWFSHTLRGHDNIVETLPRVKYFQMGENDWRSANEWPPANERKTYYLDSDGAANTRSGDGLLTEENPRDTLSKDSFRYDPLDPVPSRGGNTLMKIAGYQPGVADQAEIEQRDDVLVYTTPRLTKEIATVGRPELTLFIESSAPDTDFTGKLVDVEPDGYCVNVSEGILRARYRNSMAEPQYMEPGEVYEMTVQLWPTAHTFEPGHRIRVEISSSNFPRFDRNPNRKMPVAETTESDMTIAVNQVYHDRERASKLVLPTTND